MLQGERAVEMLGRDDTLPDVASRSAPTTTVAEATSSRPDIASAVVARPVLKAAPLREDEAWLGVPGESGSATSVAGLGRSLLEVPGQGLFLAALLSGQDPSRAVELSVNALLDRWGEPPLSQAPDDLQDAMDELAARGISTTRLAQADLQTVRRLGYPALLSLQAGSGETRTVALVSLDDEIAGLTGVREGAVLRVPVSAVEEQWGGGVLIIWRSYLDVPNFIVEGDQGAGVLWLQEALGRLGYLNSGITGTFDLDTIEGVQDFQLSQQLTPDGVVGPLTLMLLYAELDEYEPPRLGPPGPG